MKKTIMFLGVLSLGLAQAQQEFEGKVGVNTETPSATLNVKSKTGTTSATKNFELENANSTKMVTVLDNGNVGIGTDSPTAKLHVYRGTAFVEQGHFTSSHSAPEGGNIAFQNDSKKMENVGYRWRIHNMGRHLTDPNYPKYIPGLHFLYHDSNGKQKSDMFFITDEGKIAIGLKNTLEPTEKLHIKGGNVRVETLPTNAGANTDKVVVVDNDGILKSVDRSTLGGSATQVGTGEDNMPCNEANRGKMNFKKGESGKSDVFGVCLKNTNGSYNWAYLIGGGNLTNGTGTFGNGLQ